MMQITMVAGAVFAFGVSALSSISDAALDLAEEGSVITFGDDELLRLEEDGKELQNLSLGEESVHRK
jgi:hypothetical protein